MFIFTAIELIQQYLDYETTTEVSISFQQRLRSPKFTLCPIVGWKLDGLRGSRWETPAARAAFDADGDYSSLTHEQWLEVNAEFLKVHPSLDDIEDICFHTEDVILDCQLPFGGGPPIPCQFKRVYNPLHCACFEVGDPRVRGGSCCCFDRGLYSALHITQLVIPTEMNFERPGMSFLAENIRVLAWTDQENSMGSIATAAGLLLLVSSHILKHFPISYKSVTKSLLFPMTSYPCM